MPFKERTSVLQRSHGRERQTVSQSEHKPVLTASKKAGEGNGNPLQHFCLEKPMNTMKRQKVMSLKQEPPARPSPRSVGVQYIASEKEHRNSYGKNEEAEPKWKHTQVWLCLLVKVKI